MELTKEVVLNAQHMRVDAALYWDCEVEDIDWPSCMAIAMRGENLIFMEEAMEEKIRHINLVGSDWEGKNPQDSFVYIWENLEKKIPGEEWKYNRDMGKVYERLGKEAGLPIAIKLSGEEPKTLEGVPIRREYLKVYALVSSLWCGGREFTVYTYTEEDMKNELEAQRVTEEKEAAEAKAYHEKCAKIKAETVEREKQFTMEILKINFGSEYTDPSATVTLTEAGTGKVVEMSCANVFDGGYVALPKGIKYDDEKTPFEKKAIAYMWEFSPISTRIRM